MEDQMPVTKDNSKNMTIDFKGNKMHLLRKDPYGYIYLSLEHGALPEKYQGAYTNMRLAEHDARRYIDDLQIVKK